MRNVLVAHWADQPSGLGHGTRPVPIDGQCREVDQSHLGNRVFIQDVKVTLALFEFVLGHAFFQPNRLLVAVFAHL
ncbi:hypothetical protein D3C74_484890 [compost metagenome]